MMSNDNKKYKSQSSKRQAQSLKLWWSKEENKEKMRQKHIGRHTKKGWHHSELKRKQISETMKRYWRRQKKERTNLTKI
ncbi:MAG: hypothetical protein WA941_07130 [Nitrososphaeraceae archaeon]